MLCNFFFKHILSPEKCSVTIGILYCPEDGDRFFFLFTLIAYIIIMYRQSASQHWSATFIKPIFTTGITVTNHNAISLALYYVIIVNNHSGHSSKQQLHEWQPLFITTAIAVICHIKSYGTGPMTVILYTDLWYHRYKYLWIIVSSLTSIPHPKVVIYSCSHSC